MPGKLFTFAALVAFVVGGQSWPAHAVWLTRRIWVPGNWERSLLQAREAPMVLTSKHLVNILTRDKALTEPAPYVPEERYDDWIRVMAVQRERVSRADMRIQMVTPGKVAVARPTPTGWQVSGNRELLEVRKGVWVVGVRDAQHIAYLMAPSLEPGAACDVLIATQKALLDSDLSIEIRVDPWFRELSSMVQLFWAGKRPLPTKAEWERPRLTCRNESRECRCMETK